MHQELLVDLCGKLGAESSERAVDEHRQPHNTTIYCLCCRTARGLQSGYPPTDKEPPGLVLLWNGRGKLFLTTTAPFPCHGSCHGSDPKRVTMRAQHGKVAQATARHKPLDRLGRAVSQRGLVWQVALLPNHPPKTRVRSKAKAPSGTSLVPAGDFLGICRCGPALCFHQSPPRIRHPARLSCPIRFVFRPTHHRGHYD